MSDIESPSPSDGIISHQWLSVEGAALVLGVSVRTIDRRRKASELESRIGIDGRREVLITQFDSDARPTVKECQTPDDGQESCPTPATSDTNDANERQTNPVRQAEKHVETTPQARIDAAEAILLSDSPAQAMAVCQTLALIARSSVQDARRARRAARFAWILTAAGGLSVAAAFAIGSAVVAGRIARARVQAELAQVRADHSEAVADKLMRERDGLRLELAVAGERAKVRASESETRVNADYDGGAFHRQLAGLSDSPLIGDLASLSDER